MRQGLRSIYRGLSPIIVAIIVAFHQRRGGGAGRLAVKRIVGPLFVVGPRFPSLRLSALPGSNNVSGLLEHFSKIKSGNSENGK